METSSQCVAIGLLTGLPGLVNYLVHEVGKGGSYINGWYRLKDDRLSFLVCCALVSRISDALLAEVLAEGRVLRNIETLKGTLSDDMMWLSELPSSIFDRLSELCPLSPVELRSKCMGAGQVNIAFIEDRIFYATQRLPFKLAIGTEADLAGNLERLEGG